MRRKKSSACTNDLETKRGESRTGNRAVSAIRVFWFTPRFTLKVYLIFGAEYLRRWGKGGESVCFAVLMLGKSRDYGWAAYIYLK